MIQRIFSAMRVQNPKDFLEVTFALVLKSSTTPLESWPLASSQLSNSVLYLRSIRASRFIALIFERMLFVHQESGNRPAQ